MFKLPEKAEEKDTSDQRKPKPKITFDIKSLGNFSEKATGKIKEEKKAGLTNDLDAFFGETKSEPIVPSDKEVTKEENKETNEEEYEYEYIDE